MPIVDFRRSNRITLMTERRKHRLVACRSVWHGIGLYSVRYCTHCRRLLGMSHASVRLWSIRGDVSDLTALLTDDLWTRHA